MRRVTRSYTHTHTHTHTHTPAQTHAQTQTHTHTHAHSLTYYDMVWYGAVWYGIVWYGIVWYGMVWYGMVWYGSHPSTINSSVSYLIGTLGTPSYSSRQVKTEQDGCRGLYDEDRDLRETVVGCSLDWVAVKPHQPLCPN
jgi:hypothetical protein